MKCLRRAPHAVLYGLGHGRWRVYYSDPLGEDWRSQEFDTFYGDTFNDALGYWASFS